MTTKPKRMIRSKGFRRGMMAAALLLGGILLLDKSKPAGAKVTRPEGAASVRVRAERRPIYQSHDGRETLRLVMDRFVARGEDGSDVIKTLRPPATAETLAQRLTEHDAPRGVFPLAYDESDESDESDDHDGLRVITSEIRAKLPRAQAARIAQAHGLTIRSFPDYAPEWVIFAAANPFDALEKISGLRDAAQVEAADVLIGRRASLMALPDDPLIENQWHLKASGEALPGSDMNVEDAWNYGGTGGVLGNGVKIAIVDSGTQSAHPDFAGNFDTSLSKDFITGRPGSEPLTAVENHGTAVAGVAAARGNNGLGVAGVAPNATLVGARLVTGDFTTDAQNAAALAHRTDVIDIKNNSWGYGGALYYTEPLLEAALANSTTTGRGGKGTIFTFAAGNDGDADDNTNYSELTSSIYTIAVGATDSLNRRAFYSEPGANLVISAPSHGFTNGALGITTTDRTAAEGYNKETGAGGDYHSDFSGTSSSCPAVSGVIALMLEKNPNLGWRDVQEILIRSARKIRPTDPGWFTNAAGLHFHHDFGAGLVDATAAVNLAAEWTNSGPQIQAVSKAAVLSRTIPNNSPRGVEIPFVMPASNMIAEQVTLSVTINHTTRGNLQITLTSPSGTESRLAEVRDDEEAGYAAYTFSTVRTWGENSAGTWRLKVADRSNLNNTTGGTLRTATLTVFGTQEPLTNPPPVVNITSPTSGAVFSPDAGFTIAVDATDLDIDQQPATLVDVQLFENGNLVATDTEAPYTFFRNPPVDFYSYTARATDAEGLQSESSVVNVFVRNQSPEIKAATLSATGQAFADTPLTVVLVDAVDPESEPIVFSYRWESSENGEIYQDAGVTTASLSALPARSGKLWRCVITPNDGNTSGAAFTSATVNLLDRPSTNTFASGAGYTYQSGLVLAGDDLVINRPAIIHEFSQGPVGRDSEWIEILTLEDGSLSGWRLEDGSGKGLIFSADAWDEIPAGTLIVIRNGTQLKDPLLPVDDLNPAGGSMSLSSNTLGFFSAPSVWPTMGNTAGSLTLKNAGGLSIHGVSFGNSISPAPVVGRVTSGEAAYFVGRTDMGANNASEWIATTASVARTEVFSFPEPATLEPRAEFSNGLYRQNFNVTPGDTGILFPDGWSAFSENPSVGVITNIDALSPANTASSAGGVFNFGSRIGMLGGVGTNSDSGDLFDNGFFALSLENTIGLSDLRISYDVIKIIEQTRSMRLTLEYTTSNPANASTLWTAIAGGSHISGNTPNGTVESFNLINLPAAFNNRETPIHLRWHYRSDSPSGRRDAIAIDDIRIQTVSIDDLSLSLSIEPATISEISGSDLSVGTVTINKVQDFPFTAVLSSSDLSEATVPNFVIIPAGQLSATFPISAVNDQIADGTQTVMIQASADGFNSASQTLTVTDASTGAVGVTPALPNSPENTVFIQRLREGRILEPATFHLATGTVLPIGLSLNSSTGLISGTISPMAALGKYIVTIERRNVLGAVVSQPITITIINASFAAWIAGFDLDDETATGDPDQDLLPNLVEYALGSLPGESETPAPLTSGRDANSISITYTRDRSASDVTLIAEWSPNLTDGSWQTEGITEEVIVDGINSQTIRSSVTMDAAQPTKFLRLRASIGGN